MQDAYQVMLAIKQDPFGGDPPILMSERIAKAVQEKHEQFTLRLFQPDTVLVPVPKSSLHETPLSPRRQNPSRSQRNHHSGPKQVADTDSERFKA